MSDSLVLPAGVTVFERGWLSSNNVLLRSQDKAVLVDSGYHTHAAQTVALVALALEGRPLDLLLNTHLHSDHCGGNAALQRQYPAMETWIPPGLAGAVTHWDTDALTYVPTGQSCERFRFDRLLHAGQSLDLGGRSWQVHAAPGHDPHSVILFEPQARLLISADALWANGFGVVFPELEGLAAFEEVAQTFDVIERLDPLIIIPGHGAVFGGSSGLVAAALARARSRLEGFVQSPARHASHAAKVLIKFKLLELQQLPYAEFMAWALRTSYFRQLGARYFADRPFDAWLGSLVGDLVKSGAAARADNLILNA